MEPTADPPAPLPPAPAAAPLVARRRVPPRLPAYALLALAVAATAIALIAPRLVSDETSPLRGPLPPLAAALAAAVGTWLLVGGFAGVLQAAAGALGLALAAGAFGLGWTAIAWSVLGFGAGAAVRWGFAQQARARWFMLGALAAAYAVAGGAAVVRVADGRGLTWVAIQGLGSLAAGAAALRWLDPRLADRPSTRRWARIVAVGLVGAGALLPYAALVAAAMHRAA